MTQLSKAAFLTKYTDVATGLYRSGQGAGAIGPDDHQVFVTDIKDSFLNDEDGVMIIKGNWSAATNTLPNTAAAGYTVKKGYWYKISVAGIPFGSSVEVGAKILVLQDNPTALAHYDITY